MDKDKTKTNTHDTPHTSQWSCCSSLSTSPCWSHVWGNLLRTSFVQSAVTSLHTAGDAAIGNQSLFFSYNFTTPHWLCDKPDLMTVNAAPPPESQGCTEYPKVDLSKNEDTVSCWDFIWWKWKSPVYTVRNSWAQKIKGTESKAMFYLSMCPSFKNTKLYIVYIYCNLSAQLRSDPIFSIFWLSECVHVFLIQVLINLI